MRRLMKEDGMRRGIFTGIHSTFSRGDFHSVEGVPLPNIPHKWAEGEPDNYNDKESCIMMLENGDIADVTCEEPLPYVCFKKSSKRLHVNGCGLTDPEYALDIRTGSCYKFHRVPRTWSRSFMTCTAEGGQLAIINSETESTVIREIFAKNPPASMPGNFWKEVAFMGFHDWGEHGEFLTIEGVPLPNIPHKWAEGEPDNYNDKESCIMMLENGDIADVTCEEPLPYVCFKKSSKRLHVNGCGLTDPEYALDIRTGSCYKFHRVPRTWSRSFMTCTAEGGQLAIINSETESTVIREIFAKNPPASMPGNFWKEVAFMGFHDWGEHGEFLTIEGDTLAEAGYAKFSPGQPDNATTGEFCGGVFRTGLYDDLWCENTYAFICEKSPDSLACDDD